MARLFSARECSTVYGLTAIDARGPVADRVVTAALGWQPGSRLNLRVTGHLIVVTAIADGLLAVSGQSRVHLPAAARYACGIRPAVRVHALVQRATRDLASSEALNAAAFGAAAALVEIWPAIEHDTQVGQTMRANTIALRASAEDHLWQPSAHILLFRFGDSPRRCWPGRGRL
jgi:hypothetical protein